MKKLLIFLLRFLIPVVCAAQDPNQPKEYNWAGYRGNPLERTITLAVSDTLSAITVVAYVAPKERKLESSLQPTVQRIGRGLIVRWSAAQTTNLPDSPGFVEVSIGGIIKISGTLSVSKKPLASAPGSLTLVNYVLSSGGPGSQTNQNKFYTLENAPSGTILTHNGASRLLLSDYYWSDTGQLDNLWRVEALNDNQVILRGPPSEQFSGTLVLTVFQRLNN